MDDEAYWHEGEPRIIASGRWEQDEYGDTTYIPDHIRPSSPPKCSSGAASASAGGAVEGRMWSGM
jgi:hypothetical protein